MAGRRPPHLERRDGVYYFRAQLPKPTQERLARREVRVSLHTRDYGVARKAVELGTGRFQQLCAYLTGMANMTDAELKEAVRRFGRDLLANAGWPGPFSSASQETDRDAVKSDVEEDVIDLTYALEADKFDADDDERLLNAGNIVVAAQAAFEAKTNLQVRTLDPGRQHFVKRALAMAALSLRQRFLERLEDPFAPHSPEDTLFGDLPTASKSEPKAGHAGPTLKEAIDKYIEAKSGVAWTSRTEEETKRILALAAEFFGSSTPISCISKSNIRDFRDCVLTWVKKPPSHATLAEIRDAPKSNRISAKTASKYFGCVTAAFSFWSAEGYIEVTPAQNLKVQTPKNQKLTERQPFLDQDLKVLFSSPLFTGCAGKLRRMSPGDEIIKDGYYWIPLIGALSGMRVTEIVQLLISDVDTGGDVPAFKIRGDKS